ncbi:BSD domain-containing protein 1-A-like [Gossypium australe]|uniref:BSD domain-containing protein 1-A-like n=1 Tax=Gossypium australe TaxID=47621 RepID=A0A5B6VNT9_9ROSI|nr:BSD domain-containing protein 1-A-like [Gossypium australe]
MMIFHLKGAQDRMRQQANKHRTKRIFNVGDWVHLKLQPYQQFSVRRMINQKFVPKFFGSFLVESRVGRVAYKLQLPPGSKIHLVFHVSQLKKHVGTAPIQATLPLVDEHGA